MREKIWKSFLGRMAVFCLLIPLAISFISLPLCQRKADDFYYADLKQYKAMGQGMDYWIAKEMGRESFHTGSDRFDGEWLFGTYLMTAIGYTQVILQYPETSHQFLPQVEKCLLAIQQKSISQFDSEAWGESPFAFDRSDHAAYLGYYNLALSLYHLIPSSAGKNEQLLELNHRVSAYLDKRLKLSPLKLLQSYPKEIYSVDNCAVIASLAVYDKALKKEQRPLIQEWLKVCRSVCMDKQTGTLIQAIDWHDASLVEYPRASGTLLGVYFLSFADFDFAKELYQNARQEFYAPILGFGATREYTRDQPGGLGDIDSGPLLFGYGLSPMGFMLGCARIFDDSETFRALYATCVLGGAPVSGETQYNWATGGPVGDGIMFGMLTSLNKEFWEKFQ